MSSWVRDELERITRAGLLRRTVCAEETGHGSLVLDGRRLTDFASNDYLGFSHSRELIQASIESVKKWGCGSRASRLMSGSLEITARIERATSRYQGTEAALYLGSGYVANTTVIPALAGRGDAIFLDRLCHASIVDGVLLSGARFFRFSHNDVHHLGSLISRHRDRYRHALIITESVFSMDGDLAPIREIMKLKKRYDAMLMADEAHALGIFGRFGEGLISRDQEDKPEIIIGTFGKALGSYGAFAACSSEMREYLVNRCRGLIFSTALPPAVTAANIRAMEIVPNAGRQREKVLGHAERLRDFIRNSLKKRALGTSHIVPLVVKSVKEAKDLERFLLERGIFTRAIRPPTVPENEPRIRFSITADHSGKDIQRLEALLSEFFSYR